MPGKPGKGKGKAKNSQAAGIEGLFDDGALLGFLQSTLEQMEAAAGGQLGEERAKLHELQLALGGLGLAQQAKPAALNDDLAIAGELDKLQQQLEAVEQQIAAADSGTKALLAQSAAKWAGDDAPGSDEDGEAAADGSGAGAGAAEGAGSAAAPSAVDAMLASGLLPVAEEGDGEEELVEQEGPAAAAGPSAPP